MTRDIEVIGPDISATLYAGLAIANDELEKARADAAQWRARYMAAHDVLLCVEDLIESGDHGVSNALVALNRAPYVALRAAFLAYRAAIEAGAPLGWAVAEEPTADAADYRSAEQGCS